MGVVEVVVVVVVVMVAVVRLWKLKLVVGDILGHVLSDKLQSLISSQFTQKTNSYGSTSSCCLLITLNALNHPE